MTGHPLRPATRRRLGRPSPHQQADRPRAHPPPENLSNTPHARHAEYSVLDLVSKAYPKEGGRLLTYYSPVRHSCTPKGLTVRLACVKHAASVRPEPGSNSPQKTNTKKAPIHTKRNQKTLKTNNHQKDGLAKNPTEETPSQAKKPNHTRRCSQTNTPTPTRQKAQPA